MTFRRDWHIVFCLAIGDIRACKHRGTTGSLASTEMVSEAPAPRAKLTIRRSQVPWPPEGHRDDVRPGQASPGTAT